VSSVSSFEAQTLSISHSTSLDSFQDCHHAKHQKSFLRKCVSLNNLKELDNDDEDDGYVMPSVLPLSISNSCDYLTILPDLVNIYEELKDVDSHYESVYYEPEYCTILVDTA